MKKRFFFLPFLFVASIIVACKNDAKTSEASQEEIKELPVITIPRKDTILPVEYVTAIQSIKNVEIHPLTRGTIEKVLIHEGQYVHQGQVLMTINDAELQIQLSRANAAYNSSLAEMKVSNVEFDRVQTLVNKKVVPYSELELAQAKYNAAKARADQALAEVNVVKKQISYTQIRAPFSGIIDRIHFKAGSLVDPTNILTSISDNSSMNAYFDVSEKIYYDMMQNGGEDEVSQVTLILPNGTPYEFKGNIVPAESEISDVTGSIAYKVKFPNPKNLLRHGASGKLILDQSVRNAFLVPQKSVVEIQDKYYVFVVDDQNKVKMFNIVPSNRMDNFFLVTNGLSGDEKIVYEGVNQLRDGEVIKAKPVK